MHQTSRLKFSYNLFTKLNAQDKSSKVLVNPSSTTKYRSDHKPVAIFQNLNQLQNLQTTEINALLYCHICAHLCDQDPLHVMERSITPTRLWQCIFVQTMHIQIKDHATRTCANLNLYRYTTPSYKANTLFGYSDYKLITLFSVTKLYDKANHFTSLELTYNLKNNYRHKCEQNHYIITNFYKLLQLQNPAQLQGTSLSTQKQAKMRNRP